MPTHITVTYSDSSDAYRVEVWTGGSDLPDEIIDIPGGAEHEAREHAARMATDRGLAFFEWSGEGPSLFDAIEAFARANHPGVTDAEWDYSLAEPMSLRKPVDALAALRDATYMVANGLGASFDVPDAAEARQRADVLWDETAVARDAAMRAARDKSYAGWSVQSGGPIRYADED